jgi:hypothetical protein
VRRIEISRAIRPFVRGFHGESLERPEFNNNDEGVARAFLPLLILISLSAVEPMM